MLVSGPGTVLGRGLFRTPPALILRSFDSACPASLTPSCSRDSSATRHGATAICGALVSTIDIGESNADAARYDRVSSWRRLGSSRAWGGIGDIGRFALGFVQDREWINFAGARGQIRQQRPRKGRLRLLPVRAGMAGGAQPRAQDCKSEAAASDEIAGVLIQKLEITATSETCSLTICAGWSL
jgi:hypothetical protein